MVMDQPADLHPPYAEVVEAQPSAACSGETITRIDVFRYAPSSKTAAERAMAATSDAVGIDHVRTKERVIRSYLRLREGQPCTERGRIESARLLRAQRIIASAEVTAIPDGEGRVRIRVDVVDELPWVVGAHVREGALSALRFGTQNFRGQGLTVVASGERGNAYRPGFGVLLAQNGAFGRPAVATVELERRPLGGLVQVGLTEPFVTDGQRHAFHVSLVQGTEYALLVRPVGDDAAAKSRRSSYDMGWVTRVGTYGRNRVVGLAGLMVMGNDLRPSEEVVVVSDSGLVREGDTELVGRYENVAVGRVAGMLGVRALRFETVSRHDALRAAQDVGSGVQVSLLAGPSLWKAASQDVLVAGDLYAGTGDQASFGTLRVRAEGRRSSANEWDAIVGSARAQWHLATSDRRTRIITLTGATMHRMEWPAQLTLRDPDGGVLGHPDSRGAGGQRMALRVEERVLVPWFRNRADFAVSMFADAGRLWAGDVPYGRTTPVRASLGLSLLGAYPSGGKRTYRVDFAVPLNPEPGGARFAIRLSAADLTSLFWREPRDVSHARAGPGPTTLMRW